MAYEMESDPRTEEEIAAEVAAAEAYAIGYEDGGIYALMRRRYLWPGDTCTRSEHLSYVAGFHDGHFGRAFDPIGAEERDASALPAAAFGTS